MARSSVRKALVPAAGRGTRFLPFTKAVPKELAPLVTTPALEFVVAEAAGHGLSDVLLVVSEGKRAIVDYFASDAELEGVLAAKEDKAGLANVRRPTELARIQYVTQDKPRGLGDAVARGEDFTAGEAFVVLLPDDIVDEQDDLLGQMLDVHARHGGVVLGLVDVPRADIGKYGCVVPAPGADPGSDVIALADLVEKPAPAQAPSTLAIMGRYVLPPQIFDALRATDPGSGGEIQLTDAIQRLVGAGTPLHGVVFRGCRYDTGDRMGYVQAVVQLAARHPDIGPDFTAWLGEYVTGVAALPTDGLGELSSG